MINLDFADVQSVMSSSGQAFMGIGMGKGEDRAMDAMQKAMHSPLLGISVEGARAVLVNVTGSQDMSLLEVNEAVGILTDAVDEDANIILALILMRRWAMTCVLRLLPLVLAQRPLQRRRRRRPPKQILTYPAWRSRNLCDVVKWVLD